ncbi:hypothetical protein [Oenococcus oeni]|uniref:hypothetical protein n=1 Tax=Oenococcus oeni TaxID=1247 RepID=UPI001268AC98|nr:hypothetical protein [Oenococcus oeni]
MAVLIWIYLYSNEIFLPVSILVFLSVLSGLILPSIFISWLVIGLMSIGMAILILGRVFISFPSQLILLFVFPFFALISFFIHLNIFMRRSTLHDLKNVRSFARHMDSLTNLRGVQSAEKFYKKCVRFVRLSPDLEIDFNVTLIRLAHQEQFYQLDHSAYTHVIYQIADTLKYTRLPSEHIFYIGSGDFLLLSASLSNELFDYLNRITSTQLNLVHFKAGSQSHNLQYKWGSEKVTQMNVKNFSDYGEMIHRLNRKLETEIVVEYL